MSIKRQPLEYGITALVGKDDKIDQYDYGASQTLTLTTGELVNGYIHSLLIVSGEDGSGAIQHPACRLVFFDADPAIAAGDTNITLAEAKTIVGSVTVADGDWTTESAGTALHAYCYKILTDPIPFHGTQYLYVALYSTDAAGINDAAGDDEVITLNVWYERTS